MRAVFKTAFKEKKIVSLCVGKVDWEERIIGYVKFLNSSQVSIDVVDVYGSTVKNKIISIDRITVVEINDSYNKHLEKLKKIGKVIKKAKPLYYYNRGIGFNNKLEQLKLKRSVCTFFFDTEYITGVIKKTNEGILFINSIGYRGTNEGESYCKINSITKIRCGGALEKKISYLQKL